MQAAAGVVAGKRSDDYVRTTVFLATVLFLVGARAVRPALRELRDELQPGRGERGRVRRNAGPVDPRHRALEVLGAVSRHGVSTVSQIARDTGLNGSTVVRCLETLESAGFVRDYQAMTWYAAWR